MTKLKMKKKLTSFDLKIIALISMFCDHLAAVFLSNLINASYNLPETVLNSASITDKILVWVSLHQEGMWLFSDILRLVGRLAFPIYCFLLIQGFLHTKNLKKYIGRLALFALISEIPFDLAFSDFVFERYYNNVFITLLIGILVLCAVSTVERFCKEQRHKGRNKYLMLAVYLIGIMICLRVSAFIVDDIFYSDYGSSGIIAILILYFLRKRATLSMVLAVITISALNLAPFALAGLLAAVLINFYNGEKGRDLNKYVFYLFYPTHLLLLVGLSIIFGVYHFA
ncbi:TraX family protein [Alloiococcus sp. CFN-8]|uniref:TraX family protein n=1 Tax=Alloiococcus sp. CFN-8 TaxID=3416081 RepID=UPI003CED7EF3